MDSKCVLLFARDAILFGDVLPRNPHVVVLVNVPEPITNHGIEDLCITHAESLTPLRQEVGCVGHGFHATGYNHRAIGGLNGLLGKPDSFQSRPAYLVDGQCANLGSEPSKDRSLARRVLTETGGKHVAHDAFVDHCRIDPGALHSFTHHNRAQLSCAEIREAALELSHWSATGGDDDGVFVCGYGVLLQ